MRNQPFYYLEKIFANHPIETNKTLHWEKLRKASKEKSFDYLYSMHEAFHAFKWEIININKKYENEGMSDAEFLYTAVAYTDAMQKIGDFCNLISSEEFRPNMQKIVETKIIFNLKSFDGDKILEEVEDYSLIKIGLAKTEIDSDKYKGRNLHHEILKRIRNKMVHPNSPISGTIHISGNHSSAMGKYDSKKWFEFKRSFDSDTNIKVHKGIYLEAIREIHLHAEKNIEYWNKKIEEYTINKAKNIDITDEHIISKLNSLEFPIKRDDPFFSDNYDAIRIYKAGVYSNNDEMKRFAVRNIYLSKLFENIGNSNFWKSNWGNIDIYKYRWNFIKVNHSNKDSSSPEYASEKIGYWEDWDARDWFPSLFDKIDKVSPGEDPVDIRIYAHVLKDINWGQAIIDQEKFIGEFKELNEIEQHRFLSSKNNPEKFDY